MDESEIKQELWIFEEFVGKDVWPILERSITDKKAFRESFAKAIRLYRFAFVESNIEPLRDEIKHLAVEREKLVRHLGKDNYLAIIEFRTGFVAIPQDLQEKKGKPYK